MRTPYFRLLPIVSSLALLGSSFAHAQVEAPSLEDLMKIEVTSVSKKPQKLANVAAAVHVISAEEIRMAGVQSIAEALQLAPGMSVIRLDSTRWGVNARGYGDRFANKLLVMIDGINVFNPAINGVFWETFQLPIEDIARIEVVRGPATSAWGANGVNGVINIVTKSASSTQGHRVVAGYGNYEGEYVRAATGGANATNDFFYRAYAGWNKQNDFNAINNNALSSGNDGGHAFTGGFRLDGYSGANARWDISADLVSRSARGGNAYLITLPTSDETESAHMRSVRARYSQTLANKSEIQVQAAVAHSKVNVGPVTDHRTTFDLDAQHHIRLFSNRHDVLWGVNYRLSKDETSQSDALSLNEPNRTISYVGVFAQDEIELTDNLRLTLAVRVDDSALARRQVQPTARMSWNFSPTQTLWASASDARRAPSRGEVGLNLNVVTDLVPSPTGIPAAPQLVPVVLAAKSVNPNPEKVEAVEFGWRAQWASHFSTDLTVFHHKYESLREFMPVGAPLVRPGLTPGSVAAIVQPAVLVNSGSYSMLGGELALDWRVNQSLRFQFAGWWNQISNFKSDELGIFPPAFHGSLRATYSFDSNWSTDLWVRHIAARNNDLTPASPYRRNAVTTVDANMMYRINRNWELAVMGRNLTDSACGVYEGNLLALEAARVVPTCTARGVVGQVRVDF